MPTLQLQVEIDSEVHPELYALLAAVGKASLRPERLRQLAAGGLIWEHLRAQPRLDAAASPALAETARVADRASIARAAVRAVSLPPVAPVEPAPEPAPAPEEPPVLQDVVELNVPRPAPRSRSRAAAAPAVPAEAAPAAPEPRAEEPPAAPLPEFAGGKKPGPRSRLLLMKERGLFKNS
jgi:hypothetical protein